MIQLLKIIFAGMKLNAPGILKKKKEDEKKYLRNRIIIPITAFETEIVRIRWTCFDGSRFEQYITIPPYETRKRRNELYDCP